MLARGLKPNIIRYHTRNRMQTPQIKFPSGDVQVYLWMLRCGNIIHLTLRFLDVEKFTNLTPLSLLISCKLSFPIVSLKMSSLPTLALKSPNRIFKWYLGNVSNTHSNSS
jgi:hypothetical protein